MVLLTAKKVFRPYLSPLISKLPFSIRRHIRRPGSIEATERRLADISSFDSARGTAGISSVVKKLKGNLLDISPLSSGFIYSLFLILRGGSLLSLKQANELADQASLIDSEVLDVSGWLGLYQLCCMRGLYHLGFQFREKALALSLNNKKDPIRNLAASLEKGGISKNEFSKLLEGSNIGDKEKVGFLALSSLLSGDGENKAAVPIDYAFKRYLEGKSIALVGPSESHVSDAEEIDSYDEVIRLNFSQPGKGCDDQFNGNKATVTYFNFEQVRAFCEDRRGELPESVRYACLKSDALLGSLAEKNLNASLRRLVSFDGLFFNGSLNMGPIAALDIALHSSFPLKIYHMDLMLTVRRFQGYYPDSFERDSEKSLVKAFNRSTVVHDPITQYRLLKGLWESEAISGDQRFDEVMQLGCEKYMQQLQDLYANFV